MPVFTQVASPLTGAGNRRGDHLCAVAAVVGLLTEMVIVCVRLGRRLVVPP